MGGGILKPSRFCRNWRCWSPTPILLGVGFHLPTWKLFPPCVFSFSNLMGLSRNLFHPTRGWFISSHSPWDPLRRDTPHDGPRHPSRHSQYTTNEPETFSVMHENLPVTKWGHPIYQSSFPDHSGNPRDVRDLIRDSEQHSVTNHITQIRIKQRRTLSVQTLRVRELCRHDPRDSSVNIQ